MANRTKIFMNLTHTNHLKFQRSPVPLTAKNIMQDALRIVFCFTKRGFQLTFCIKVLVNLIEVKIKQEYWWRECYEQIDKR